MSTNYYAVEKKCRHCDSQEVHFIGKSSIGWKFLFSATETRKNILEVIEFITREQIELQYEGGMKADVSNFLRIVFGKQETKRNVPVEGRSADTFTDDSGFDFMYGEFS